MHLVVDNYSAHKHQDVTDWLNAPGRKDRWHLHFTQRGRANLTRITKSATDH